jgi:hypothetical protein
MNNNMMVLSASVLNNHLRSSADDLVRSPGKIGWQETIKVWDMDDKINDGAKFYR